MSRIERERVVAGDTVTATNLNDTYNDYAQSGGIVSGLDERNVRDQAFDLPHCTNLSIVKNQKTSLLGNAGLTGGGSPTTLTSATVTPVLHPVQTSGGTQTILDLSSSPWTIGTADILRVWWNLSVYSEFTGTPWLSAGAKGLYAVNATAGAPFAISDGLHCWLVYLEWDITSSGLTNWEPVSGQLAPTTTYDGNEGVRLSDMAASSVISPWALHSFAFGDGGTMPAGNTGSSENHGWFANYGMWAHAPGAAVTVYGIRVIIAGLVHPAHRTAGDNENLLVFDYNVSATLKYNGGRITGLHMRRS